MKRSIYIIQSGLILAIFGLTLINFTFRDDDKVKDFKLKNVDGSYVSLSDYPDAKGFIIIFTCNHCPFAKLYPARLNELNLKYKKLGIPLLAISSTDTIAYEEDTYVKVVEKSNKESFNFPYLYDGQQIVAKNFKAQKTPHAYVIWKEKGTWKIKYQGAIDDNGAEPEKVENNYIALDIEQLLNNKEVKIKETKSIGCQIRFRK
jgi:peroxiredoxin